MNHADSKTMAMDGMRGEAEENGGEGGSSYRYWVRETREDAAPPPVPKKLSTSDLLVPNPPTLGSVWNKAGTWEEKDLNKWASQRIKELLLSMDSLNFSSGSAQISEVPNCSGDAFLITVRNKKRVGYNYELTLKIKGEWIIKEEKRMIKGDIDIPEFSFGELNDLEMRVRLGDEKDLSQHEKLQIVEDLKLFLQPVRQKLLEFEQELKDR